jgi:hypothetical protein
MEQHTVENGPASPPVKLAVLALELGVSVDEVERELGAAHIFRHGGFRVCSAFEADELTAEYDRRKVEAEAAAQRAGEAARAKHEAGRARAAAERANPESRVQKYGLSTITVSPVGPEGVPAVVAMMSQANADFEGGVMTKRPSRLDWLIGKGEGGSSIGPTREQIHKAAEAKKIARKGKGTS